MTRSNSRRCGSTVAPVARRQLDVARVGERGAVREDDQGQPGRRRPWRRSRGLRASRRGRRRAGPRSARAPRAARRRGRTRTRRRCGRCAARPAARAPTRAGRSRPPGGRARRASSRDGPGSSRSGAAPSPGRAPRRCGRRPRSSTRSGAPAGPAGGCRAPCSSSSLPVIAAIHWAAITSATSSPASASASQLRQRLLGRGGADDAVAAPVAVVELALEQAQRGLIFVDDEQHGDGHGPKVPPPRGFVIPKISQIPGQ